MNIATIVGLLLVGLAAGMLSSMVGIGGGLVIVPSLVFFFAFSQKMAQGTSLALLLPPIGILAVMNYYKAGYVDFKIAAVLAISFILGSYLGSKLALGVPDTILRKIFGLVLGVVSIKYLFFDK